MSIYSHISREQAHAINAWNILRAILLLRPKRDASTADVLNYFEAVLSFALLLAQVGVGIRSLNAAKLDAAERSETLLHQNILTLESSIINHCFLHMVDALVELQSIRERFRFDASERAKSVIDVHTAINEISYGLKGFGMGAEVIERPSELDLQYIEESRSEFDPCVSPMFFLRDLWPSSGDRPAEGSMPYGFKIIILEDWKSALSDFGDFVGRYESLLSGMSLNDTSLRDGCDVTESKITVSLSDGSSSTGSFSTGKHIRMAVEATDAFLGFALEEPAAELIALVTDLISLSGSEPEQARIAQLLATFLQQSSEKRAGDWHVNVSGNALIEAAQNIPGLLDPIRSRVSKITTQSRG